MMSEVGEVFLDLFLARVWDLEFALKARMSLSQEENAINKWFGR